ncbi:MAG: helix-turn-helix transcriptional regulator [Methanomassiliicoccaceae archaeon]|jgi:DNA-binding HxlR family transcriptional regulator|nr:helix-turn-helix transcriptional regulator [Methanomassiliicoccaceae archaeon]
MSVIEGRWKAVVLCKLRIKSEMRFNQLMREIDGVSPRMLTKQLKEMERDGLIIRKAYAEIPPRVEYSLTEKGMSLIPLLISMAEWGLGNMFPNLVDIEDDRTG